MWEGVVRGASIISDVPAMVGSMVLVTDGNNGTGTRVRRREGSCCTSRRDGRTSFGVQSGKLGGEAHELADATGGVYQETNDGRGPDRRS